jgi:orotate phosphoribosyltransferase
MEQELLNFLSARKGHFRLESGYHGGLWLDLDPLFVMPGRIRPLVEALAERLQQHHIEAVCGPMTGGAFLAQAIASLLDIEFYYAQRFVPAVRDTLYARERGLALEYVAQVPYEVWLPEECPMCEVGMEIEDMGS